MSEPEDPKERFEREGFVVLPRYLDEADVEGAVDSLPAEFPTANEFHENVDPARN